MTEEELGAGAPSPREDVDGDRRGDLAQRLGNS